MNFKLKQMYEVGGGPGLLIFKTKNSGQIWAKRNCWKLAIFLLFWGGGGGGGVG